MQAVMGPSLQATAGGWGGGGGVAEEREHPKRPTLPELPQSPNPSTRSGAATVEAKTPSHSQ